MYAALDNFSRQDIIQKGTSCWGPRAAPEARLMPGSRFLFLYAIRNFQELFFRLEPLFEVACERRVAAPRKTYDEQNSAERDARRARHFQKYKDNVNDEPDNGDRHRQQVRQNFVLRAKCGKAGPASVEKSAQRSRTETYKNN